MHLRKAARHAHGCNRHGERNPQKKCAEAVEHGYCRLKIAAGGGIGDAGKCSAEHDERRQYFENAFEAPEDAKPRKQAEKVPTQIFVPRLDQAEDNDKERRGYGNERVEFCFEPEKLHFLSTPAFFNSLDMTMPTTEPTKHSTTIATVIPTITHGSVAPKNMVTASFSSPVTV